MAGCASLSRPTGYVIRKLFEEMKARGWLEKKGWSDFE
jgi:hypothetical protein